MIETCSKCNGKLEKPRVRYNPARVGVNTLKRKYRKTNASSVTDLQ